MDRPSAALSAAEQATTRSFDRLVLAHDASHYLLVPESVATPEDLDAVLRLLAASRTSGVPITFRSGGTSLSGQGVTAGILADTRRHFRRIEILDDGHRARVQPGATVRQVNQRLARFGRKLGPDPASEVACTIGGVVANNSSGMACGTEQNSYQTVESLVVVLPSGTVLDTGAPGADAHLRSAEPDLHHRLLQLRDRVRNDPAAVQQIRTQFAIKNTMGYSINALLDFDLPVDILTHLIIGSEGTLGFVAEVTFRTVPLLPVAAAGLAIFPTLDAATGALPDIVATQPATIELLDAASLRVAQQLPEAGPDLTDLDVDDHAALLIEYAGTTRSEVDDRVAVGHELARSLQLAAPLRYTSDPTERANLWHIRKGLYTSVAGARPSGTTALLEDVAVPVPALYRTCVELIKLFEAHGYVDTVIFGHAKDGNIHFMINEQFDDPANLERYRRFTDDLVDLVLGQGGTLKAEHGTGRIMAPFVRRQYGDTLYELMGEIKQLCDPYGLLNPGVTLSDDPDSYLRDIKTTPTVEEEVDRCVECGYCEPVCPSKDLTLTPRQRITTRREMENARAAGDTALLAELQDAFSYDGLQTCAADGICATACPVKIDTGELVKRLRAENVSALEQTAWATAAKHWSAVTRVGAAALTVGDRLPEKLVTGATRVGRAVLGADVVPLYDAGLPRGGRRRRPLSVADPDGVYFPACLSSIFGAADAGGVSDALLDICAAAGLALTVPDGIADLCCGTPWTSKGYRAGNAAMAGRVLPLLWQASEQGRLPIVCDTTTCSQGLAAMRDQAADGRFSNLRFVDAVEFVHDRALDRLKVVAPVPSIVIHPTCSSTRLGINDQVVTVARAVAAEVTVPDSWGCCGFAGDRGLLHPELTAAATAAEAAEVNQRQYAAYVSTNRTCELALSRATGQHYRHLLELLRDAVRPATLATRSE